MNISGIMQTVTLVIAALLPMVNGCGLVCDCFAIRGFTSRLFQISENTFYYNIGVMYAANCSDRNLSGVPYGLHDDVSTLFLDHNNLTHLSNNIFANKGLQKLDALYLNNNSISLIEEKAFFGLNGLQTLVLDGNKITTLPLNVFEPCEHLKYISMRGNNLILSDSIFHDKTKFLQTVMISHCNLRTLPKDFTSMQLSDLDISNNDLGDNIVLNFPVQSLKISNNNIIDLTKEGTKLSSLKILDLRGRKRSIQDAKKSATWATALNADQ
ncbi:leucine-rich repeat transmembrane neuronal protein 3 isoform X2 [Anabrus simplex]|uniref:leucine-rich repeat transmembrane neuronal protein 3 isoform X2 n=1 Tax=Anabrus simplex TaxID=316456 RepID=UPI0035A29E97